MNVIIHNGGYPLHAELLSTRIAERIPVTFAPGGMEITLSIDPAIGKEESYSITGSANGWHITGADNLGLYFGIGKFLHSALWNAADFAPKATDGVVTPACSLRMSYFSTHFYNYYYNAPKESLERYIEDLLLWGYNVIHAGIPISTIKENDEQGYADGVERVFRIYRHAKKLGMKISTGFNPNQGYMDAPKEIAAEPAFNLAFAGNLGKNICLSKPAGAAYMRKIWQRKLETFKEIGLDYIVTWPYDEGGCGCKDCHPWGAKRFLDGTKWVWEEATKVFPDVKIIASTWVFDDPVNIGEFDGLYQRLQGDMSFVDYIIVDAHGEYPRYPLEHDVVTPVANFPEISMWGLYPWGGFGANPLPERMQALWDSSKKILSGGQPYSEGVYEDISKIQFSGYYWEPDKSWQEILSEYINYEYCPQVTAETLELLRAIEINHVRVAEGQQPDMEVALRAKELSDWINEHLSDRAKNAWRWRVLYIRAQLDYKRYTCYMESTARDDAALQALTRTSGDLLIHDEQAQDYFRELWKYYYCVEPNGCNMWTLPPLGGTIEECESILQG